MTISLVMPDDERAKILVELPHRQKNGRTKVVKIWLPKLQYIEPSVMADHRAWRKQAEAEHKTALDAWQEARVASISDKTVEVPDQPEPRTELEAMRDLARRLIPDEWDTYLEHLPNGVKQQLFTEWAEQSAVSLGESSASKTSSPDQE